MSTLRVDSILDRTGSYRSAGRVLQVVFFNTSTTLTTTSTSYVDSGLEATITPSSTSSKILILAGPMLTQGGPQQNTTGRFNIVRGSTQIAEGTKRNYDYGISGVYINNFETLNYLDSPATTSATTYKVQIKVVSGANIHLNQETGDSHITLMEIAG